MEQEKNKDKAQCKPFFHQSFIEKARRIKMAAEMGLAQSSTGGRQWSCALRRRLLRRKSKALGRCCSSKKACMGPAKATVVSAKDLGAGNGDEDDEVVEIEKRVKALKRLVPGAEDMEMEKLFEVTAEYIEALRGQVSVMRALTGFLDGLGRERRLKGG